MRRYDLISLIALLILVAAVPVYLVQEPDRMDRAQAALREQFVANGAVMYVENCVTCHGPTGEGVGAMPALNRLASADSDVLHRTIAHSPHGSAMAYWHVDEGGVLNDYQVVGLVTLIQNADWLQVGELAAINGVAPTTLAARKTDIEALEGVGEDPHECRACHEEPEVHADRFGLNCARCHTLQAWKPALLTRHTFLLDHGGEGQVACQTCHTYSYSEHTCYECHDHTPEQMEEAHAKEEIFEFENCAVCHPTGQEGEGELFRASYGLEQAGGDSDTAPDPQVLEQEHILVLGIKESIPQQKEAAKPAGDGHPGGTMAGR
jgi:mono/diheme cytochrome c family protein